MNWPKITVICFAYNHSKYIEQCLDGILSQTIIESCQLLIHDDCSSDDTVDILKAKTRGKEYVELVLQEKNIVSQGRNLFDEILWRAKGTYIAICDGDDFWQDPYKLEAQSRYLDKNPALSLCYHGCVAVNERGEKIVNKRFQSMKSSYSALDLALGRCVIPSPTMFFKNSGAFSRTFLRVLNADLCLLASLSLIGSAGLCSGVAPSSYRIHVGGVWSDKNNRYRLKKLIQSHIAIALFLFKKKKYAFWFLLNLKILRLKVRSLN